MRLPVRGDDPDHEVGRWWALAQDERRAIFEETSRHTQIGLAYLPAVARQLYHCRDLGEPFDFVTWFEFAPEDEAAFDDLLVRLRATPEWTYIDREVDIRLAREGVMSVARPRRRALTPQVSRDCGLLPSPHREPYRPALHVMTDGVRRAIDHLGHPNRNRDVDLARSDIERFVGDGLCATPLRAPEPRRAAGRARARRNPHRPAACNIRRAPENGLHTPRKLLQHEDHPPHDPSDR